MGQFDDPNVIHLEGVITKGTVLCLGETIDVYLAILVNIKVISCMIDIVRASFTYIRQQILPVIFLVVPIMIVLEFMSNGSLHHFLKVGV